MLRDQIGEGPEPSTTQPDPRSVSAEELRPPLQHQIGWTLAGNLSYAAAQWGMLIVLAKTVSPAGVGQFGLGLAIATPVLMLSNFQLRSLQATRASDQFHFSDYLGFRYLSSAIALLAIMAIAFFSGYEPSTARVVVAVGFAKCVESIADTVYGHLQSAERMNRIAVSMAMKGALSLLALYSAMWISRDVLTGVMALAVAWLVVLVAYDLPSAAKAGVAQSFGRGSASTKSTRLVPRWTTTGVAQIGRLGLPLAVTSLFLALANSIPRYFLERWHGEEVLGYFTALAHPTAAFTILLSAFGQAATPRMALFYKSNRREFWRIVLVLGAVPIAALAIALPALVAIGPGTLAWLYRGDYAQFFQVFLILLVAGTVWSLASVLGYAATASGKLAGQAPVSAIVLTATIIVSAIVIPSGGLIGAAFVALVAATTTLGAYVVLLLWRRNLGQMAAQ